jgi:flagellar biosynthesis protein FlhG
VKVIAVSSGKGGVGKTTVVVNLAFALASVGKKVMILDSDLALGNIDILLGLEPKYNLTDVIAGRKKIHEIVVEGPGGIRILPASSGIQEVTELSNGHKANLLTQVDQFEDEIDFLLIDTGAGVSSNVMFFNAAARKVLVVASPEPTCITDAFALMKILTQEYSKKQFQLVINSVKSESEAKEVCRDICEVSDRFLDISIDYLGFILYDPALTQAAQERRAIVEMLPGSPASLCFRQIADELTCRSVTDTPKGSIQFFLKRIFQVA